MKDMEEYYINAGIVEPEDIKYCDICKSAIMPWYLICEGCGDINPLNWN